MIFAYYPSLLNLSLTFLNYRSFPSFQEISWVFSFRKNVAWLTLTSLLDADVSDVWFCSILRPPDSFPVCSPGYLARFSVKAECQSSLKSHEGKLWWATERQTDRHTWFFVMFGFWLVDFFGILNPFQSTGTSLIMSTTSLICKIHYVMTYLLKKFYLLTKIQFVITYVAYNFLKYDLRVFLPDNGNVLYFIINFSW